LGVLLYYVLRPVPVPTPPVPGSVEAAAQNISVTDDLEAYCEDLTDSDNPNVGRHRLEVLMKLAADASQKDPAWRYEFALSLSQEQLKFGEADEAIRVLAEELESEEAAGPDPVREKTLLEALAIAHLKKGELDNCLTAGGRFTCTLPLEGSGQKNKRGSQAAAGFLEKLLAVSPENVRYRWLLNIAHMALGTYPEAVPATFLIPPTVFESEADIGRFEEIAPEAGLYNLKLAGGGIVDDFDNDGLLDIVATSWDPCGSMTYYHNDGDGRFSDHTTRAGLDGQTGGLNAVQTDYNNDGWLDVLVVRGGWMRVDGRMRMSLLRNNGDNTFTDVTYLAGVASPAFPRNSALWTDFDLDGDLDLYACSESEPLTRLADPSSGGNATVYPSQLFRNDGDGTFTDVAWQAGVTNDRYCKGSNSGDYDNDGDQDIYVSNFAGDNRLYRNDGDGTFTDVARESGVIEPQDSFATWFWDYDNDGWLDIFVAGYGFDLLPEAADYLGLPNDGARMKLYRNLGGGGFEDVTKEAGLYRVFLTMGSNYGDFDNDGYPDFLLGTGTPSFDAIDPGVAYRNNGTGHFKNVTFSAGFGHLQKGHGTGFGDLDRDGDQDVFVQMGGFRYGDRFLSALYENPGHGNRWLSVKLMGTKSNRAAIGARVRVVVRMADGEREVHSFVTNGGSFGASSLEQEMGLGQALAIEQVEVRWPSGAFQMLRGVPLDSRIEVVEGEDGFRLANIPAFRLAPDRERLRLDGGTE